LTLVSVGFDPINLKNNILMHVPGIKDSDSNGKSTQDVIERGKIGKRRQVIKNISNIGT